MKGSFIYNRNIIVRCKLVSLFFLVCWIFERGVVFLRGWGVEEGEGVILDECKYVYRKVFFVCFNFFDCV